MTAILTKQLLTLLSPARIWPGNSSPDGSILDCEDVQTEEDLMVQLRLSLKHYIPQENDAFTFKSLIRRPLLLISFPLLSHHKHLRLLSPCFFMDYSFFSFVFHSSYFLWSDSHLEVFAISSSTSFLICAATFSLIFNLSSILYHEPIAHMSLGN